MGRLNRVPKRSLCAALVALFIVIAGSACTGAPTPAPPTRAPSPTATSAPTTEVATLVVATLTSAATAVSPSPTVTATSVTPSTLVPAPTASPTLAASPATTITPLALLPAPQLTQPSERASLAAKESAILAWTWTHEMQANEYFEIQLAWEHADLADFACTAATQYVIAQPPFGYGNYRWRVIARRGTVQGDRCTSQGDLSQPSAAGDFTWRSPSSPSPSSPPYP